MRQHGLERKISTNLRGGGLCFNRRYIVSYLCFCSHLKKKLPTTDVVQFIKSLEGEKEQMMKEEERRGEEEV